MTRHSFVLTIVFFLFAPFFYSHAATPLILLQKLQGTIVLIRNGIEITAENSLKEGFLLKEKDQIRTNGDGRVNIASHTFSLQLAPHSFFIYELAPQEGRPAVVSLVYGHLRSVVRPKKPSVHADVLRVRLPGFFVGVKNAGPMGADFLVHSARNKADFLKQLDGAEPLVPRVHALSDMNILPDHYIRVDALAGDISARADESSTGIVVTKGAFVETSKKSETPLEVKSETTENLIKVRKLMDVVPPVSAK